MSARCVLDEYRLSGYTEYLVCLAVDADERGYDLSGLLVNYIGEPSEVAGGTEVLLVLVRELDSVKLLIEIRLLADKMGYDLDIPVGVLAE